MQSELETRPRKRKNAPLPPIQRHPAFFQDNFQNSKLLTYNLRQQKEEKLKNIM